ncbi:ABC transporter ATP-binding protein [Nocardia cyriacigeorgica]|uniref:ABC transporter ATP-binding protein n=1 Tax=Nocardia cyriacigeorgica TaxID=135487 RepID=UPI000CEA6A7C|nr:ATP-binding cassette domain-containing protein [Nocardia cyriacigeorgica]AVH24289.1 sulfonate ABC transporter ATP-binding protein [Nocardia cyriacigeorgica]MBF6323770.1 ABC transporter ATP-binding protein [Nocardia cyriacigeorgica]PPJ16105.1 sulfonate ABC transporter ATP-binding protein [Nocardia cyriacigeorgica]
MSEDQGTEPVAVSITGLRKSFGDKTVLDGVDLIIRRGEFVVLLGPSGTGKTTLLRLLTGLEVPDAGEVLVPGRRTTVYQEPRLIPSKRVLANVLIGLRRNRITREAGLAALAEVQLDGKANQWPATLSGGEAQRAALARALVRDPELLLLDEPFAALDALTRLRMQDLVGELVARHRPAVLMVTHDVDEAVRLADRVIVLDHGRFAVDTTIAVPRPRERTDPDILRYHTDFLAHLGVGDPDRRLLRSTP